MGHKRWVFIGILILALGIIAWQGEKKFVGAQEAAALKQEVAFDFGEVKPEQMESAKQERPKVNALLFALPSLIFAALLFGLAGLLVRRRDPAAIAWVKIDLSLLPDSFKVLITLPLVIYSFVHLFALATVYLQTKVAWASVEEYFFYMKPWKLLAVSHAHLFGHATMYSLVGLAFLFTRIPEKFKILILAIPVISAPLDVYSWWLIKFISGKFELLSMVSGLAFSLGFLVMAAITFYELWFRKLTQERQ